MPDDAPRSRRARAAAEQLLVDVVNQHGSRPELVLLGGLVPELLCSRSELHHAGTTDVDVQVDLEIASGSVNAARLERSLRNAGLEPDREHSWRWRTGGSVAGLAVRFELLADLDDLGAGTELRFDGCEELGATNLRGTGFASRDAEVRVLGSGGGTRGATEVRVAGLAGFMLAKCAAARSRRKPKDWYDLAFVLLHNDAGGPEHAADAVLARFTGELARTRTALDDLKANFADPSAQGSQAYADQMVLDHPSLDRAMLAADAVIAVEVFHARLLAGDPSLDASEPGGGAV